MKIQLVHKYKDIISVENLCQAWQEFIIGKKKKEDVLHFSRNLMDNIVNLHEDLVNKTYQHGGYESFYINDPKRRHIHKATVRDRLLHHAVYRILYPFFDRIFISDSYSCRNEKGTHKAINRFRELSYRVSKNNMRTCWVLKCDIRKFFASIDHEILLHILNEYIPDTDIIWLLENIIESFETNDLSLRVPPKRSEAIPSDGSASNRIATSFSSFTPRNDNKIGLPLGNLTSQLFSNIYLNKFDQWVKHALKSHYYIRYADDFVFLSRDKFRLEEAVPQIQEFLQTNLKLSLHPDKLFLRTVASGMDFLGWVNFPDHRILRNTTKRRMLGRIKTHPTEETFQSYVGLLSHGNAVKTTGDLLREYWLWK